MSVIALRAAEWPTAPVERLCGQGLWRRVSGSNTVRDGAGFYPETMPPVLDTEGYAVVSKKDGGPAVLGLLGGGRPDAVVGLVATRTIKAFDGVLWRRPQPHIVQECFERISPTRADRDASRAVVTVGIDLGVTAPLSDAAPHSKFWRAAHSVRSVLGSSLFFGASTTGRQAPLEVVSDHIRHAAALTATVPVMRSVRPSAVRLDDDSTEASPSQVDEARIRRDGLARSHAGPILPAGDRP